MAARRAHTQKSSVRATRTAAPWTVRWALLASGVSARGHVALVRNKGTASLLCHAAVELRARIQQKRVPAATVPVPFTATSVCSVPGLLAQNRAVPARSPAAAVLLRARATVGTRAPTWTNRENATCTRAQSTVLPRAGSHGHRALRHAGADRNRVPVCKHLLVREARPAHTAPKLVRAMIRSAPLTATSGPGQHGRLATNLAPRGTSRACVALYRHGLAVLRARTTKRYSLAMNIRAQWIALCFRGGAGARAPSHVDRASRLAAAQ